MSKSILDEFDEKLNKDYNFDSNDDGAGNDTDFTEDAIDAEKEKHKDKKHKDCRL